MFTGIIQSCCPIVKIESKPGLTRFVVQFPSEFLDGLKRGASVAVDGVCLTAIDSANGQVSFEAMRETLTKTTLGNLIEGRQLNIERSARFGDEIGGHLISGHVTGVAAITAVETPENNHVVTFQLPTKNMKYIFPKGFIALDGASLTVVDVDRQKNTFTVHMIPETLRRTTFGFKKVGDLVNFEIDSGTRAIVDTTETVLKNQQEG